VEAAIIPHRVAEAVAVVIAIPHRVAVAVVEATVPVAVATEADTIKLT
jgi:hypothetical protein